MKIDKMLRIKVTNTYIPGVSERLYFRSRPECMEILEDIKEEDKKAERETLLKVGVTDARNWNSQYKSLILDLKIDEVDNNFILEGLREALLGPLNKVRISSSPQYSYAKMIQEYDHETKNFVVNMHNNGWSFKKLSAILEINEVCLRAIVNEDK